MELLKLSVWFLFIAFEIVRNYWMIEKKKSKPIYLQSFVIRGMAAIFHGILWDVNSMLEYAPLLIFQVTSFYVLFDPILNLTRGKSLTYRGRTSGWMDKLGPVFYLFLKALCVVLLTLSLTVLL